MRLITLVGGIAALLAVIRLMKAAWYLYRRAPKTPPGGISGEAHAAGRLAGFALANRKFLRSLATLDTASAEKIRAILGEADGRFRDL